MKYFTFIGLCIACFHIGANAQQSFVIDHQCDNLQAIPAAWITAAKADLHIGYGHTSHGSQLASGMDAIDAHYMDDTYNWSHEGGENTLHLFEGEVDGYLEHDVGYDFWDDETREYLDDHPECNVIIWSWCGQVEEVDLQSHYFTPMAQLESEYPDVTFVYMTGHLEGRGIDGPIHVANEEIRDYCLANSKILYDFADIEKYDPDAEINYQTLYANDGCFYDPDGTSPVDRTSNWADEWLAANPAHELTTMASYCSECAHSVSLNCIKKGIAAWYLWARLAGWDGTPAQNLVTDITITSEGDATSIDEYGGTLQLYAEVLPTDAANPEVTWSVNNETGEASVDVNGLVTAIADGAVEVVATAVDGSGVSGSFDITITNQTIPVTNIIISSEGDATEISTPGGTLQLYAEVLPVNASNPAVLWSVLNGTGEATISNDGLVTAVADGSVTAKATALDGSGIYDEFILTMSNQPVPVEEIIITSEGDATSISTQGGTLQLYAEVLPSNATNPAILWSVQEGTGQASISTSGLVTAGGDGTVTAIASATDGSGISGSFPITITGQTILVDEIIITSEGDATEISTPGGTLQLYAEVLPSNASDALVIWSVQNTGGQASVNSSGLLTAIANGEVIVTVSANDGSGVSESVAITISNQPVPVASVTIHSAGDATEISTPEGTLQLTADVLPADATNPAVEWSIENVTGEAGISSEGLVSAMANGTVIAKATATDGSAMYDEFAITISGQIVPVEDISISSQGNINVIEGVGNTLQLSADVLPADASDPTLTWSVENGTGAAIVDQNGLVTATAEGTVTVNATANDGSGVSGEFNITIAAEVILIENISVRSEGDISTISTQGGTLQLFADVLPANASNPVVLWSVQNGSGQAAINPGGLITASANGTVTAVASATDGSGISGEFVITISGQEVPVTNIAIQSAGGATSITTPGGTLQLTAIVLPADATQPNVSWSVQQVTGQASISNSGLVTAIKNGTVRARATATDGSGVSAEFTITITNQIVAVSDISISSPGDVHTISSPGGTLQLSAQVLPADASNKQVLWSVQNGSGSAQINTSGLVTALGNGSVTAVVSSTDGSGVSDAFPITITNQVTYVNQITITAEDDRTTIDMPGGTLQLSAEVSPSDASNPGILWSVQNGTGRASVSTSGLVTAIEDGSVAITASAVDGSGKSDAFAVSISNQFVMAESLAIYSLSGSNVINIPSGSLYLRANVTPANASNKQVLWSIASQTGWAEISEEGVVSAIKNGTVTAIASTTDGSGLQDQFEIRIQNQPYTPVEEIMISSEGDITDITENDMTLQLYADVLPGDATDKRIEWGLCNVTGMATISGTGLVNPVSDGIVYATATSLDNTNIHNYLVINISGQIPDGLENQTEVADIRLIGRVLIISDELLDITQISIIDLNGRTLLNERIGAYNTLVDLQDLKPGIYIVRLLSGQKYQQSVRISLP